MPRSLTSAVLAAMASANVSPVIFVQAQFTSGTIYVWSGIGPISWNSQTWTGVGYLGKITPIQETTSGQAKGVTLEMSGIPSNLLNDVLNEISPQYPVYLYIGYLNSTGAVIANPEQRFSGRMDVVRLTEGGDSSLIKINVESKLIDLNRARERHYTHQDQQIDWPGDNGFIYVNGIQELAVLWGTPGTPINNLPTIGSVGGNTASAGGSGPGRGAQGGGYGPRGPRGYQP
ncbi:MAG TPA: hypothetical protein VG206_02910 [Terriglobia bacterium]|nr:hypothetical protein [Terriglobia bacterium]